MRRKLSIILLVLLICSGLATGFFFYMQPAAKVQPDVVITDGVNGELPETISRRVSVLLIGTDKRPQDKSYNTDTLILASIDPLTQRISLLSIPRDTKVDLAGHGSVKINSVVAMTNINTLLKTVANLTGLPLAGYIQTNFQGFKKIIDTLGGITVDVEKDMYYETGDKEDGIINLKKGVQRLDGSKALQYARFRHDALGDISRTARQQVVLKAVAKEMFKLSTLPKLPWLVPQLMEAVQTDLSLSDILKLAKVAATFQSSNVISQTLPGAFLDQGGVSYWDVDPIEARKVVQNLLNGITTDKIIDHEAVELLKPVSPSTNKPLPKVPGNSQDPNGQESSGYNSKKSGDHDMLKDQNSTSELPISGGQKSGTFLTGETPGDKGQVPSLDQGLNGQNNQEPGNNWDNGWPLGPDGGA